MPIAPKCPSCSHDEAQKIRFTPWGGVIGPRLLSLVKCTACGIHYNGKSGRRVETAIRLYTTLMLAILILLAACMIYSYAGGTHSPANNKISVCPSVSVPIVT
jgi:hypothetical protein